MALQASSSTKPTPNPIITPTPTPSPTPKPTPSPTPSPTTGDVIVGKIIEDKSTTSTTTTDQCVPSIYRFRSLQDGLSLQAGQQFCGSATAVCTGSHGDSDYAWVDMSSTGTPSSSGISLGYNPSLLTSTTEGVLSINSLNKAVLNSSTTNPTQWVITPVQRQLTPDVSLNEITMSYSLDNSYCNLSPFLDADSCFFVDCSVCFTFPSSPLTSTTLSDLTVLKEEAPSTTSSITTPTLYYWNNTMVECFPNRWTLTLVDNTTEQLPYKLTLLYDDPSQFTSGSSFPSRSSLYCFYGLVQIDLPDTKNVWSRLDVKNDTKNELTLEFQSVNVRKNEAEIFTYNICSGGSAHLWITFADSETESQCHTSTSNDELLDTENLSKYLLLYGLLS